MAKRDELYGEEDREAGFLNDGRGQRNIPHADAVRIYFNSVRKYPLLAPAEELHLTKRVAKGDKTARRRMVEGNLRLVINIAKKYANRGMPFQDLIEEGNIGLIKAVEKFKPNKGCKFSTYATYWIKQTIERGIINQSKVIRLPVHVASDIYKMMRVTRELTNKLCREPSMAEISHNMGTSGRYVNRLSMIARKNISLDANLREDPERSLMDIMEDDKFQLPMEMLEEESRSMQILKLLGMLEKKEQAILLMRFGLNGKEPRTLESIGKSFGVTRERVRQIEARAMNKIRNILKRQKTAMIDM